MEDVRHINTEIVVSVSLFNSTCGSPPFQQPFRRNEKAEVETINIERLSRRIGESQKLKPPTIDCEEKG